MTPTGRTRPGVKVQDGCDHRCTYCIVWKARGPARSVASGEVIAAVAAEVAAGAHEVVLTGINVGSYADEEVGDLAGLLRAILAATDIGRLRIASIEPEDVSDSLLRTMASAGERIAPFLHICLQSGCDVTLRRMGRPYDTASFAGVVNKARSYVSEIALGTDVIVGFPGETEHHAAESLDFCRAQGFSRMHVFRYSRRPGTPAATMTDQVDAGTMAKRAEQMRAAAHEMRCAYAAQRLGREEWVLVQEGGWGVTGGLLDAYLGDGMPAGSLVHACVRSVRDDRLTCELLGI